MKDWRSFPTLTIIQDEEHCEPRNMKEQEPEREAPENVESFDSRWLGASIGEEHWHFHRQLLQRYSIVLAPGEFSRLFTEIKTGKAPMIERRRDGAVIYSVRIRSVNERIYVLAAGLHIISAWPPNKKLNEKRRQVKKRAAEHVETHGADSHAEERRNNADLVG